MTRTRITAKTAAFVVWEEQRTFDIVMTAECVSTSACMTTTIARVANTSQTVPCVKSFSLALGVHPTKCLVAMQFIGSASDSLQHTTPDVQCVKRQQKQGNG